VDLPFIDEDTITIAAPRDVVWSALERQVATSVQFPERSPFARILGTDPPAGFEIEDSSPLERLALAGRHRFSRYRLVFELTDGGGASLLHAKSYAEFPGLHGRTYRALVIGTRLHVVATNRILRSVQRRSLGPNSST
jgi:hypothetical protein